MHPFLSWKFVLFTLTQGTRFGTHSREDGKIKSPGPCWIRTHDLTRRPLCYNCCPQSLLRYKLKETCIPKKCFKVVAQTDLKMAGGIKKTMFVGFHLWSKEKLSAAVSAWKLSYRLISFALIIVKGLGPKIFGNENHSTSELNLLAKLFQWIVNRKIPCIE